jgi:hypothetical protein
MAMILYLSICIMDYFIGGVFITKGFQRRRSQIFSLGGL